MKKLNFVVPVLAIALLSGAALSPVHAKSDAVQKAPNEQVRKELSQEQRVEVRKLVEASRTAMQPLRQQMFVKKEELKALQNAQNPDVAAVSKKATEISDLRTKVDAEEKKLGLALDKAMGLESGTHAMRDFHGKNGHRGGFCSEGDHRYENRGKRGHERHSGPKNDM